MRHTPFLKLADGTDARGNGEAELPDASFIRIRHHRQPCTRRQKRLEALHFSSSMTFSKTVVSSTARSAPRPHQRNTGQVVIEVQRQVFHRKRRAEAVRG